MMSNKTLSCLASTLFVMLAGCSSTQHTTQQEEARLSTAPLTIPSSFKDTAPRALQGQYSQASWADLPGWSAEDAQNLWIALYNDCRGLMRQVSGSLSLPARATPQAWKGVCTEVAHIGSTLDPQQAKHFIQDYLQPWKVQGQGLATGYYEPVVQGSRHQGGDYQWPMYGTPSDLLTIDLGSVYPELAGKRVRGKVVGNKVVPYDTRAQISQRSDKPPVIVWLNDPVEAFFLQVQGSGRVMLENGQSIRLAYANHNGRPYTSIGKWLADHGELALSKASMQNIKAWAKANPTRVPEMLNSNQAMVFFKEEPLQGQVFGPTGAYGIPLVDQRSVAVDPNYEPLGTPLFLATTYPASSKPLQKIVFAQDTGAAIKGAARVDYFWGSGEQAGQQAGRMKQSTQVWLLWPKTAGMPSAR